MTSPAPAPTRAELARRCAPGRPVRLEGLDTLAPAAAADLLDFFLHDPAALGPVEPFASLLAAMIQKREVNLWDLLLAAPGAEDVRDGFLRALPREHSPCLVCPCFPVCQGYAAYAGSCATWLALLPTLAAAARELTRLCAQLSNPSHARGPHALPEPS